MSLSKQTPFLRTADVDHPWFVVDLKDVVLGRAAVQVANILRGKDKPNYTPNADTGGFVVIINAAQVALTGKKMDKKLYRHHTNFIGGLKTFTAKDYIARNSAEAVRRAVWGMLPKGALGRRLITKLKVYPGGTHPHEAQNPVALSL